MVFNATVFGYKQINENKFAHVSGCAGMPPPSHRGEFPIQDINKWKKKD